MFKILVVEDETYLLEIITKYLNHAGYQVLSANNGQEAVGVFDNNHIDLVITDIMMPVMDGNTLVKYIRYNSDIPIIMLTALDSFIDKEKGFNSGTDDYIVKPVHVEELLLRVKSLLRRYKIASDNIFKHNDIELDFAMKTCKIDDKVVELTIKEFELLFKLMTSDNRIFTRDQLMDEIWGYDSESYQRTVDTHVKRLREKIKSNHYEIVTVRGLGYKGVLR